ncbi:MAG: cbb3-type cytochrome oxidase assembly protein CcoS [Rhodobacteraceae bacterium]|nr:cbb3-type cytochrome oxidase assembly protein CcoS [Paracoccaceae bacterium]MCY4196815.1 cbb3-type cytochrome oxidase assembly protein CcoS [Paracoccaceae bacterium]
MKSILFLIGATLVAGLSWLLVLAWTVRTRQYSDPEGDAQRILRTDYDKSPKKPTTRSE